MAVKVNPRAALSKVGGGTALEDALAVKAVNSATPGFRTTEFWLALAIMACAVVLAVAGKISGEVAMGAVTSSGIGYAVSRGIAKT